MINVHRATTALFAVAALLVIVVFFTHAEPATKAFVERFLKQYQSILTSVGTLILVGALTLAATDLANKSAANRDHGNRKLAAELKLADFRQSWIDDMRNDIAELASISVNPASKSNEEVRMSNACIARIRLRLNHEEIPARRLLSAMNKLDDTQQSDKGEFQTNFVNEGQAYLKSEWNRLKRDLEKITLLEQNRP